jgi:phosphoribosylformylglycinamidine synthase
MAARAGNGLELDLSLVPQRETGMTAYEMLLSESQERMLIVARSGREKEVVEIFNKWDLDAVVIGKVIEGDRLKIFHNGELKADLPVMALTDEAPKYHRPINPPTRSDQNPPLRSRDVLTKTGTGEGGPFTKAVTSDLNESLKLLLSSPNICSKRWVYEQYDSMVRTNTVVGPGTDAAVIRVKETRRAIAMCLDGSGKFTAIDPRMGAKLAVAESARNVVCVGARPIAVTNCLNFASPERPEVMWSFSEVVDGIADACKAFDTPVVSGNVSFYNETDGHGILPTPVIGMVGLIEDTRKIITHGFKNNGDIIAILGETFDDLAAGEYAQTILGMATEELISRGILPQLDFERETAVQDAVLRMADECLLLTAHDCSDGGLAVAIAESCFSSLGRDTMGADITLKKNGLSAESLLFGESPSRIIISFAPENLGKVVTLARYCPIQMIGKVTVTGLNIKINKSTKISCSVSELESAWKDALGKRIESS